MKILMVVLRKDFTKRLENVRYERGSQEEETRDPDSRGEDLSAEGLQRDKHE
jgi:hypothetical protein